jgi:hypothetical protein
MQLKDSEGSLMRQVLLPSSARTVLGMGAGRRDLQILMGSIFFMLAVSHMPVVRDGKLAVDPAGLKEKLWHRSNPRHLHKLCFMQNVFIPLI